MGTYAITLPNLPTRISEKDLLIQSQVNTYSTGNAYRTQEYKVIEQDTTQTDVSKQTKFDIGLISYNETLKKHYYICSEPGGTSNVMELVDGDSEWKWFSYHPNTPQGGFSPDKYVYSKKHKTYYSCAAGLAEWDEATWNYTGRGDASGQYLIAYDSKRDLVISFAKGYTMTPNFQIYLTTYDPSVASTTVDPSPNASGNTLLSANYLHNITTMGQPLTDFSHLSYSPYDDSYYFCIIGALWKTNPTTGATSLVYTSQGETMSLAFDGDTKYAYLIIEDLNTPTIKIQVLDIDTYTVVSSKTINTTNSPLFTRLSFATILYVKDILLVLVYFDDTTNSPSFAGSGALRSSAILGYDKSLSLDLMFQKRLYDNWNAGVGFPQQQFYYFPAVFSQTQIPSPNVKNFLSTISPQHFKTLAGNQTEVHIPVFNPTNDAWNRSVMLNINPVTPYPTVTTPVVDDCCLAELICDVKYKLAKNSCESTKRSIVGRHFNNVWENSQLLEAVLWVTTFDCLSCDEIEKLKCIISKI